ncbi:hypothetical protein GOB91_04600 [Sinorhizobium meliloti]|nr:hypothetical protein [Sinorhizobium meliloti]MDW9728225.1 hypothetical protein [Sinorhizobium meliloti]
MKTPTNLAPTLGAIKPRYLHDVVKDNKSRLYPGTCVIASITGVTLSQAADAVRQVRYDSRWLDFSYTPPIKMVRDGEILQALRLLGFVGFYRRLPERPTLAAYLNARIGSERDHPCVLFLSTHCVAVSGGVFCDVFSHGEVVDIDDAKGRRKSVSSVLVLTNRVAPSPIASRQPLANAAKAGASVKADRLFRAAIKAETGALRVKITPNEVFIIRADEAGWYRLGSREGVEDLILRPTSHGRLRGNSGEAAAYRKAMGC